MHSKHIDSVVWLKRQTSKQRQTVLAGLASDDGSVEMQWTECIGSFNVTQGLTAMSSPHVFFSFFSSGPSRSEGRRGAPRSTWSCCKYTVSLLHSTFGKFTSKKDSLFTRCIGFSLWHFIFDLCYWLVWSLVQCISYLSGACICQAPEGSLHHLDRKSFKNGFNLPWLTARPSIYFPFDNTTREAGCFGQHSQTYERKLHLFALTFIAPGKVWWAVCCFSAGQCCTFINLYTLTHSRDVQCVNCGSLVKCLAQGHHNCSYRDGGVKVFWCR